MKLLALDTATEGCSVALFDGKHLLSNIEVQPRKHAELILPMIEALLADAQWTLGELDAIAFGRGPGAFTGVRIAAGVTQGIAYARDLPVVAVSTLRALAQRTCAETAHEQVLTAFDARMDEVYWAAYKLDASGFMQPAVEEMVVVPGQVKLPQPFVAADWAGAGSGWQSYSDVLMQQCAIVSENMYAGMISRADEIALLGEQDFKLGLAVSAEKALPVYLRNSVAWKKSA